MKKEKLNLKGLSLEELEEFVLETNEKKYKAKQLFIWVYKKGETDFLKMTNLSKEFRKRLKENFWISQMKKVKTEKSKDGSTEKFLFELEDKEKIESVLIREGKRVTVCLSTQVGCALNCSFCATGKMGFKRNLSAGEIVDQIIQIKKYLSDRQSLDPYGDVVKTLRASHKEKITHIVIMGMGEPLLNYKNTLKAIKIIHSELGLGFSVKKITLSTSGIVPEIYKLAEEGLKIKLSLSLNSPFDQKRELLMPINKKYPIKEILKAVKHYAKKTDQRITIEYVLIKDINDSKEDALKLSEIGRGIPCKINLIAYNEVEGLGFEKPDEKKVTDFKDILYPRCPAVTVRKSKGEDIKAACGQLKITS